MRAVIVVAAAVVMLALFALVRATPPRDACTVDERAEPNGVDVFRTMKEAIDAPHCRNIHIAYATQEEAFERGVEIGETREWPTK